ncbi:MAG: formyltransferase family protein [Candidatus Moranbacteria bacterium]|nr:formyltransferase family protein [Candidatus Moranbacteria bacterium]
MSTPSFSPQKPLRVFVLFSGNATAIQYLRRMDPGYNHSYIVVGALTTNEKAPGSAFFIRHTNNTDSETRRTKNQKKESIPCEIFDWRTFRSENPENKRKEYFQKILEILVDHDFDIIVCSGFHLRIPDFFIKSISPKKIVNAHPTDLSVMHIATRKRWFIGVWKQAIQLVLDAGMEDSRSTAHYITAGCDIDDGEIIAQSQRYRLIPGEGVEQVQDRLTRIGSDGEALAIALQIICNGENCEEGTFDRLKKLLQKVLS